MNTEKMTSLELLREFQPYRDDGYSIETEFIKGNSKYAIMKAYVYDKERYLRATGHAIRHSQSVYNKDYQGDNGFVGWAETRAKGRALLDFFGYKGIVDLAEELDDVKKDTYAIIENKARDGKYDAAKAVAEGFKDDEAFHRMLMRSIDKIKGEQAGEQAEGA